MTRRKTKYCMHCSTLFYGRELTVHGFWYPWRVLERIPYGYRGMTEVFRESKVYIVMEYGVQHREQSQWTCNCYVRYQGAIDWGCWVITL